ncbi:hypothetical protein IMZ11_02650 [Microtetraspora sp. AC03309]|uniref:hypothetical protein n=1 Tax=Microtetraspora sp. AC03309 TaxID=2779376 RepID=UPI001E3FE669|nr:hypothetical protein [Microtetraspora sp. AC03309]MCC5574539.1 hypothetical protein [Microtetraspora sp. AC03309]
MPEPIYFHGGKPGLKAGDLILPGMPNFVTGCPVCDAHKAGESHALEPVTKRQDRIYVTTDREYARFYASKYPKGDLYTVEPIGELVPSDEDHFPTWTAGSARVRGVYDVYVQLTTKQRATLLRRWERADREAAFARLSGEAANA